MDERETLTWETYGVAVRELAQQVADADFVPDVVLGIARGGLIPAGSIAYALDCKNLFTMTVEFYTGVGTTLEVPTMLPPFLDASELDDARVLIVDDVADSGKTLEMVVDFCRDHVAEARTAVIYEKPRSVVRGDFVWKHTDRWINFPWSTLPAITDRSGVRDA
ncbi:phosphoribosyltransferase [Nocardioides zeae]